MSKIRYEQRTVTAAIAGMGVAFAANFSGDEYIIVAADINALEKAWRRMCTDKAPLLDIEKLRQVAVFGRASTIIHVEGESYAVASDRVGGDEAADHGLADPAGATAPLHAPEGLHEPLVAVQPALAPKPLAAEVPPSDPHSPDPASGSGSSSA